MIQPCVAYINRPALLLETGPRGIVVGAFSGRSQLPGTAWTGIFHQLPCVWSGVAGPEDLGGAEVGSDPVYFIPRIYEDSMRRIWNEVDQFDDCDFDVQMD